MGTWIRPIRGYNIFSPLELVLDSLTSNSTPFWSKTSHVSIFVAVVAREGEQTIPFAFFVPIMK